MRGRVNAIRTFKGLVADLREKRWLVSKTPLFSKKRIEGLPKAYRRLAKTGEILFLPCLFELHLERISHTTNRPRKERFPVGEGMQGCERTLVPPRTKVVGESRRGANGAFCQQMPDGHAVLALLKHHLYLIGRKEQSHIDFAQLTG